MELDVNLNEVVEKPRLPADIELPLAIIKAEVKIGQQPNKTTGQKEPYVACEIVPLQEPWNEGYKIYHNFSLTPAALSSPDATFSIKKFFAIIGHNIRADGKFSTEEVQTLRFIGKVKYDDKAPTRPALGGVLRGVS